MNIIWLETVDDRRGLADAAVLELENRHAARVVLVFFEILVRRSGRVTADTLDLVAHVEQQRVERVAAGREQTAAAGVALGVPAELPVPRADAVVVVHLPVVDSPQQPAIDHALRGDELAREAQLETDARLDAGPGHRLLHRAQILQVQRERLLDDQVFASLGGGDDLARVLVRVAAHRDNVDRRVGEHFFEISVALDFAAVFGTEFRLVEFA